MSSIPLLIARIGAMRKSWRRASRCGARVAQLEQSRASGVVTNEIFTGARNTLLSQKAELAEILEKEADLEGQIVSVQAEHDARMPSFGC